MEAGKQKNRDRNNRPVKKSRGAASNGNGDTDNVGSETVTKKKGVSPLNRRRSVRIAEQQETMETQTSPHPALLSRMSTTHNIRQMLAGTRIKQDSKPAMVRMQTSRKWSGWRKAGALAKQETEYIEEKKAKPALKRKSTGSSPSKASKTVKISKEASVNPTKDKKKPALKRPASGQDADSPAKKLKTTLSKQHSLVGDQGKMYIPPKQQWPLNIEAQIPWYVPLEDSSATAVLVDDTMCLIGTECAQLLELDASVKPHKLNQFPSAIRALVRDKDDVYVGCHEGTVYDHEANHLLVKPIYHIPDCEKLVGLAADKGQIVVIEESGGVICVQQDGTEIWKTKIDTHTPTMMSMDDSGVYVGHTSGLIKLHRSSGDVDWNIKDLTDGVLTGDVNSEAVYVGVGTNVLKMNKKTGKQETVYDKGGEELECVECCAIACGCVFACGIDKLVVYDEATSKIIYSVNLGFKSTSIKYFSGRIFCAGEETMTVLDFTEDSIKKAQAGEHIDTTEVSSDPFYPTHTVVPRNGKGEPEGEGVVLECVKPKQRKGQMVVRAVSSGWNKKWEVDFPEEMKVAGAKFLVENLKEENKSYSIVGNITKVENEDE